MGYFVRTSRASFHKFPQFYFGVGMKRIKYSRRVLSIAAAATVGALYGPEMRAQTFDTTATVGTAIQIEQSGNFTGTQRRISAEGLAGGASFAGYAVLDFDATSFSGGNLVSGINKFVINLWD